ncbi:MAG: glycoside hydrolase family 97 N-terminal domain-containing protein [Acidobacteriaceae bacterium]
MIVRSHTKRWPGIFRLLGLAVLFIPVAAFHVLPASAEAKQAWQVDSPDDQVHVEIQLQPLSYSVSYRHQPVLTSSALGLDFKNQTRSRSSGKVATLRTYLPTRRTSTPVTRR